MGCSRFSSMPACSLSRSISSRARFEPAALRARTIEISRLEPALIGTRDTRPILVGDRKPGGISALALDDHVLAEESFEAEAEAPRRAARAAIARITFPLDA